MASQTYYQRDNQAGAVATVEYDGNRFGVQYSCGNKAVKLEIIRIQDDLGC